MPHTESTNNKAVNSYHSFVFTHLEKRSIAQYEIKTSCKYGCLFILCVYLSSGDRLCICMFIFVCFLGFKVYFVWRDFHSDTFFYVKNTYSESSKYKPFKCAAVRLDSTLHKFISNIFLDWALYYGNKRKILYINKFDRNIYYYILKIL